MEGMILFWCFLSAFLGGVVLASIGALKAVAAGEPWNWAKYGISLLIALGSGGAYFGIAHAIPAGTDLWLAIFAAFTWGFSVEATQSPLTNLISLKKTIQK
jgi:hypothetical protein